MNLEIICHKASHRAHSTPLLFVHGAFAGAWCWADHFLPYFADRGFDAYAVSLRGHGLSDGHAQLRWTRLSDYVADVAQVVDQLPAPPVLIGHSMGGFVVQHYLRKRTLPGAVLMASTPPHGTYVMAMDMMLRRPMLCMQLAMVQSMGPSAAGYQSIRDCLFSPSVPDAEVFRHMLRFQDESVMIAWESWAYAFPYWIRSIDTPLHVMGAENDAFVPAYEVEATARTYGVKAEIVRGMAHAMMLDTGWELAAARLHRWIAGTLASQQTAVAAA